MPFPLRFAILIGLVLTASGCMKAVEQVVVPAPTPARIALDGPHDTDIPAEYRARLLGLEAADRTLPVLFLAVAGHFEGQGDELRAWHFLDRAAGLFAERQDPAGEAKAISRKALLLMQTGREREARALIAQLGARWPEAPLKAFPNYLEGRLALLEGEWIRAGGLFAQALRDNARYQDDPHLLELRRDTELAAGMAAVLADRLPRLPEVYGPPGAGAAVTGETPSGEGLSHLQAVLNLNRELQQTEIGTLIPAGDFQRAKADAYAFMGLDEGYKGNGAPALGRLVEAVQLSQTAGFREGEIRGLLFLAELAFGTDQQAEGRTAATELLKLADRFGAASYRFWARLLLAHDAQRQGRIAEAIALLKEADELLAETAGAEARMLGGILPQQRRAVYERLVELLAGEGRAAEAMTAAERAKALITTDLLAGQDIGGTAAERDLLQRAGEIGESLRVLRRQILQVSDEAPTLALLERLGQAEAKWRDVLAQSEAGDSRRFSALRRAPVDPAALQRLLDQDTTLFSYFVTDRSVYVWAIHGRIVHLERISISRNDLRALVLSFREAIQTRDRRKTEGLSRRVYDLLLKPVIPFVSGERLGFIPDDCLHTLPFAAMNYRGRYLAEGFAIFTLSGAELFDPTPAEKDPPGLRILAFGDPTLENEALDLRYALPEIERIKRRFSGTTVLTGQQASEGIVEERIARYDVVHFAVRGQFDPVQPLRSGLLLTPGAGRDGTLDVLDVFRLHFPGRTVVLSGCEALTEADPEARGYSLLQRAFLHAGARSVVTTLWLVEDRAAVHLLDLFYRQLGRRESPAAALRTAQLQLLREGQPPHVWAAFILTGRY